MTWTEVDYAEFYSPVRRKDGTTHAYGWSYFESGYVPFIDAKRLAAALGRNQYTPSKKTLIVGCGIGATVHYLRSIGGNNVYGADISTYIHSKKTDRYPTGFDPNWITSVDIRDADAKTQLKAVVGGNGSLDWVICEGVTETIPNLERQAWYSACDDLLSRSGSVAHLLQPAKPLEPPLLIPELWERHGWTWQSLDTWVAEKPTHYWINRATMEFRIPV